MQGLPYQVDHNEIISRYCNVRFDDLDDAIIVIESLRLYVNNAILSSSNISMKGHIRKMKKKKERLNDVQKPRKCHANTIIESSIL